MSETRPYRIPESLRGTRLEPILETKLLEIRMMRRKLPATSIEAVLERAPAARSLTRALLSTRPAIIAEIKRASPSAGILRADFDRFRLALDYQRAGARALSVLTEVHHFRGGIEHLASLRWRSRVPLLRKDFLVDSYQILESRHAGADAVLLIAALLEEGSLRDLRERAEALGMEALVEVHDEAELEKALVSGARLIGVNNRDLRTFEVSLDTGLRLGRLLPGDVTAVAESGIRAGSDVRRLMDAGFRGFLIGELFLRAPAPGEALARLLAECAGRKAS